MSEYLFKANFDIKNCLTCPVENMVVNCPCFTGEAFASDYTDSKHPNCPLVEVPPHGDLKDYDSLGNMMANKMAKRKVTWHPFYYEGFKEALKMLDSAPTVIEASKERE